MIEQFKPIAMRAIILIGTGGFIGSILRYLVSQIVTAKFPATFPWGTLVVNVTGCFIIGLLFSLAERGNISMDWRLFLATGLCGGFTTFSAFSNEAIALLRGEQYMYAFAYVACSVMLGLAATFLGILMFKPA